MWNGIALARSPLRSANAAQIPGFTAVAVLLSLWASAPTPAIFSLIDAVMLRMLPVNRPQLTATIREGRIPIRRRRLAQLQQPSFSSVVGGASPLQQPSVGTGETNRTFSRACSLGPNDRFDLARGGTVQPADGSFVSGDFFTTLGLRPAAGRLIAGSDDYRGCPPVALLSYGFWQGHYGGPSGAVGSTLSLNDHPFEIIGVAPPGFYGMDVGRESEVFVPICTVAILQVQHHWKRAPCGG